MGQNNLKSKGFGLGSLDFASMYKEAKKGNSNFASKRNTDDSLNTSKSKDLDSVDEHLKNVKTEYSQSEEEMERISLASQKIPDTKNIIMKGHCKPVTAMDWDTSGARLITGGYDYLVKLWNFGAMDSSFQSFREIEPVEGCQVNDTKFSLNGENFLVATASSQAKLFDKSGLLLQEYKKGDMYIRDMRHTSGHTSSINSCSWNPQNRQEFLTASDDSTVRIWDPDYYLKQKHVLVLKTRERGGKTKATACTYTPDGKKIFTAQSDGCISMWENSGTLSRPHTHIEGAHNAGNVISTLEICSNETKLLSRSEDQTVKVWDIRLLKTPLAVAKNLVAFYSQANACFSPNGKLVLSTRGIVKGKGQKVTAKDTYPKMVFMDSESLGVISEKQVVSGYGASNEIKALSEKESSEEAELIKVYWHKSLNQIAVSRSNGTVSIFYDDEQSTKGVKLGLSKPAKARLTALDMYTGEVAGKIITPHALSLFKDPASGSTKRRMEKVRKDPVASRKPELPVRGQGRGGVIGTSETQYIMRNIIKDTTRDEDPREALLKHAAAAEESPYWVAPAYKKHQPEPIFNESGMEDEPELKRRK